MSASIEISMHWKPINWLNTGKAGDTREKALFKLGNNPRLRNSQLICLDLQQLQVYDKAYLWATNFRDHSNIL